MRGIVRSPMTTAPQNHGRQGFHATRSRRRVERKYPARIIKEKYAGAGQFTWTFARSESIATMKKNDTPTMTRSRIARADVWLSPPAGFDGARSTTGPTRKVLPAQKA